MTPRMLTWLLPLLCLVMRIDSRAVPWDGSIYAADDEAAIAEIASEFRDLRAVKGHFDNGAWNAAVDKWMGRKHRLMIQLQSLLSGGRYDRVRLVEWLGPPDRIDPANGAGPDLIRGLAELKAPADGSCELLIYYWRGDHDFLYFVSHGNAIVGSGWWHAGD